MPEEQQGVIVDSPTTEPVVEPESQAAQTEEPINIPDQGNDQQVVPASDLSAIGSDGVPIDNREAEWKRKHDQLAERLPEYIDQAVSEAAKTFQASMQQSNTPTYTEEQLLAVKHDESGEYTAANKVWAEQELAKLNEQKIARLLDEKFQLSSKQQEAARTKIESEQYVVQQFPEMFKKDATGRVVGWNESDPMAQLTAQYVKKFGDRPDALKEAARQAFTDIQLQNRQSNARKATLASSEAAQLKRQQIGAGGGTAEINALNQQVAQAFAKFQASGSVHDAKAYNVLKGRLAATQLKGK